MQHPETDASSSSLHRDENKQTVSSPVPLMTETALSQNPGILAFEDNPASYVQVDCINNISSVLAGYKPWFGLSLDSHGPVPEILGE